MESKKINQLATAVNPSTSDLAIIGDPVTGVSKKITWLQVSTLIGTAANLQQVTDNGATTTNPVTIGGLTITGLSTGVLKSDSGVISSVPFGAANGVATLAGDGKVPSSQLPSYVDDVVEVANYAALPVTGETGKIYITLDNNKVYRWGGSVYVEIAANNAIWGSITGTLSNQTDLQNALDAKANDSAVVHLAGTETITGTKTFSNPSKNDGGILLKNGASYSLSGYMNLGGMTDGLRFTSGGGISNFFTLPSSVGYTYTFPALSGTIVAISGGNSTQYIDGTGALQTFPTLISSDKLVKLVRNQSGATMTAGTIVYISGATGNKPLITKALATGDSTSAQTYGLVQADIANNADGYVVVIGNITDIDTSALTEGQQLYLSGTTAGAYTTTKPYAPIHLVYIGIVLRSHPTQGIIGVKIQNGYELDELHDVSAQSPSNNDGIFFNTSTSLWEKKSIATALGLTPISLASLSAVSPLIYNNGTGAFSIQVATASQNGYLSSTDFSTFNNKQAALGGTGFVKISGSTISYDNSTYYLASNPSGYITLASLSAGAGISYSNITGVISSTITQYTDALARAAFSESVIGLDYSSSTGVLSTTTGYAIPTTAKQTEWDTAYTNRITSLTTTGSNGSASLVSNTLNVPTYTLSGLGGQPLDADLTAIAALAGTSGFLKKTAADTWTLDTNTYLTGNQTITLSGDVSGSGATAITTTIGAGKVTNAMLAGSIDLTTKVTGLLPDGNISSAATWNAKQAAITLTTTGTSGVATFISNTLNIPNYTYTLPTASTSVLGGVKVDGTTITINGSGVISGANTYSLPIATSSILGGVKIGSGVSVDVNGVISVSTNYQAPITLTTTGTSGAATFTSGTLNIPQYSTDLSGYVTLATTQTITGRKTIDVSGTAASLTISNSNASNEAGVRQNAIIADKLRFGVSFANASNGIIASNGADTGLAFMTHNTTNGWVENFILGSDGNATLTSRLTADRLQTSHINIIDNQINSGRQTNALADLWVNYMGYNNGSTQFRDFRIGDGKGVQLVKFMGSTRDVVFNQISNVYFNYSSTDTDQSYAALLKWNGLQFGNNGNNEIVAGHSGAGGYLNIWVNNTNRIGTPNGTKSATFFADGSTQFFGAISASNLSGTNTGDQTLAGLGGVPTSRTITINSVAYDLSANRSWSVTAVETDTLASVTARGATTSTRSTFVEIGVTKAGSDSVAAGPWFRWTNADESRQMLTQLNASNGLTWWGYNGTDWIKRMTLSQGSDTTLTISAVSNNPRIKFEQAGVINRGATSHEMYIGEDADTGGFNIRGSGLVTIGGQIDMALNKKIRVQNASMMIDGLTPSYFGYSSGYGILLVGHAGLSNRSIAFGVDVSGNASGAFSGLGSEYIWKNTGSFITPNAANNGYNTLFSWNSSALLTFNQNATFSGNVEAASFYTNDTRYIANQIQSGYNANSEDSDIWINYTGYQGGATRFRDFRVGNGKQTQIIFVDGSTGVTAFSYRITINNNQAGAASVSTNNANTTDDAGVSSLNFDGNRLRLGVLPSDGAYGCIASSGAASTGLAFVTHNGTNWGEGMRLTPARNLIVQGDVTAFSDISVKNNIRPIENVLNRIENSRGILYDRTDTNTKDNIGFIAQELEKQFPELIVTNENGTKAVKYQNAVAILFEAVKEQQKQINYLKKQVA